MAQRLLHLFETLNKLGTTVVVATHDIHLLSKLRGAQMMRLDKGRLSDPTGLLRYPPRLPQTGGRGPAQDEGCTWFHGAGNTAIVPPAVACCQSAGCRGRCLGCPDRKGVVEGKRAAVRDGL